MNSNIVFIDTGVENFNLIIDALAPDVDWFLIDDQSDGIRQITDIISGYIELDSVSIISHGAVGAVKIGAVILDSPSLNAYAEELKKISQHLKRDGLIQIFGCEVANNNGGRDFVDKISQITGMNVLASDDVTGMGGNWQLEYSSSEIKRAAYIFREDPNLFVALELVYYYNVFNGTDASEEVVLLSYSYLDSTFGIGYGGDDYIESQTSGVSYIYGENGNDTLIGGWGDDIIWGGAGIDYIDGRYGNDTILGDASGFTSIDTPEEQGDEIYGGDGDDSISGDIGNDSISGGYG